MTVQYFPQRIHRHSLRTVYNADLCILYAITHSIDFVNHLKFLHGHSQYAPVRGEVVNETGLET